MQYQRRGSRVREADLHGEVNIDEEEDEREHEVDGGQGDVDEVRHDLLMWVRERERRDRPC
jgi:hypothetical protein